MGIFDGYEPHGIIFCGDCDEEICGLPNRCGAYYICDKCFMQRLDPTYEPWLDDPYDDDWALEQQAQDERENQQ